MERTAEPGSAACLLSMVLSLASEKAEDCDQGPETEDHRPGSCPWSAVPRQQRSEAKSQFGKDTVAFVEATPKG
jgi:hypothetical protein